MVKHKLVFKCIQTGGATLIDQEISYCTASSSTSGAIIQRGPHQGAQKFSSIGKSDSNTSSVHVYHMLTAHNIWKHKRLLALFLPTSCVSSNVTSSSKFVAPSFVLHPRPRLVCLWHTHTLSLSLSLLPYFYSESRLSTSLYHNMKCQMFWR